MTTKTVDLTPIFNYSRDVEVVKRFAERVTALEALDREDPDRDNFEPLLDYIRANIQHVRAAVSGIMADDVKAQIADGSFPIRVPAIAFHPFDPAPQPGDWPSGKPDPYCVQCPHDSTAPVHTL